jgi:hypothetical protein
MVYQENSNLKENELKQVSMKVINIVVKTASK